MAKPSQVSHFSVLCFSSSVFTFPAGESDERDTNRKVNKTKQNKPQHVRDVKVVGGSTGRVPGEAGPQCGLWLRRWASARIAAQQTNQRRRRSSRERERRTQSRERERAGYPLDSGIILAQAKLIKGFTQFMANVKRIRTFCVPALTCYSGNQRPPARPPPNHPWNWPQHRGQSGTRPGRNTSTNASPAARELGPN